MRYELTDDEWTSIKPMLPNKPRGVPRVSDRRILNGIFWVSRSGAPWRDLRDSFGPYTTCYNRFVRWRRAGVGPGSCSKVAVRLFLTRHLLSFLASLREAYRDGLLTAFDLAALAAGPALCLAALVAVHFILDVLARATAVFSLCLFGHLVFLQPAVIRPNNL
jgi:transposase